MTTSGVPMKLGIMVPRESDFDDGTDPYPRIYAYCERAEELGFDFCTFTHHRFSPERPYLSSPLVMMSAIAARTSTLRLVTTVFVLPLYHPLDVAEAIGQLDHISGGRVVLGVGAGYRQYEADAVGVPFHQRVSRMTESIEILRAAWTQDTISFHGKHFDFDDVCVVPKPRQRPHPPIWIGALEPKPVARAGRIADGWIAPSLQTLDTLSSRAALYRDTARDAGRAPVICLERDVVVATDGEAAARRGCGATFRYSSTTAVRARAFPISPKVRASARVSPLSRRDARSPAIRTTASRRSRTHAM